MARTHGGRCGLECTDAVASGCAGRSPWRGQLLGAGIALGFSNPGRDSGPARPGCEVELLGLWRYVGQRGMARPVHELGRAGVDAVGMQLPSGLHAGE